MSLKYITMTRRLYSRLLSTHAITRRPYCDALVHVPSHGGFIMTGEYLYHHKEALLRFWVHVASRRVTIMTLEYMHHTSRLKSVA